MSDAAGEAPQPPVLSERLREYSAFLAGLAGEVELLERAGGDPAILDIPALIPAAEPEGEGDEPTPMHLRITADLEFALKLVEDETEAQRLVEETWSRLEDGTAKSARSVPAPRLSARRYPEYGDGRSQVDLRL